MNFAVREKVSLVQLERPCLSFLTRSITAAVDNPSPRTKAIGSACRRNNCITQLTCRPQSATRYSRF
jgi:hypothetical protein